MNKLAVKTLKNQLEISPEFFLRGYLSTQWDVVQILYLKKQDYNARLNNWPAKVIKAIWAFSSTMWKARCDQIHGTFERKTASGRRKEVLTLVRKELERTEHHADHTTRQLWKNVLKSLGNAKTDALMI